MKLNSIERARKLIHNKRKTMKDYKNKTKKELLVSLHSYIANFGKLRNNYIDILLENDFLKRKLEITEKKVKILNNNGNHHSLRDINSKNKKKMKNENNKRY